MQLHPGVVLAVSHEPLSFLRRSGHAAIDEESRFLQDHSEANIVKLAENGCGLVRFHFYKGFGLEAEKEEMEMTREYVKVCHKYGVKVQLYIQFGTLYPETLLAEQPGMMDWVQTDAAGMPISLVYGHQNCRNYPCFNKPGYWEYLETIIRFGIIDIGGDAIGFDNITTSEEPDVCRCESCRKAFRQYLKAKYRPDTAEGAALAKERFGHAMLDHIMPPRWNYFNHAYNLTEINNPVAQEWVLFRCDSLSRTMKRVYDFSKRLNPDILLEFNVYKQFGTNTAFVHGVYVPDYGDYLDVFWNECDEPAEFTEAGELHSRIRSYKMATAMGKAVFTNHPNGGPEEDSRKIISYAESMAFGRGIVSGVDSVSGIYSGRQKAFRPYRRFALEHPEFYQAEPAADVSLYESKASLSFSNYAAWYADMTMQQCLLRGHIPFDLIFSLNDAAEQYKTLVLPGMECLSDGEIDILCRFVRGGGALAITDKTGVRDNWRRARGGASLLAALGAEACGGGVLETIIGKGRVVYIAELKSDVVFDQGKLLFTAFGTNQPGLGSEYLRAPIGQQSIADAIRRASGSRLPVVLEAPEHVVMNVLKSACGHEYYVHLVNYKPASEVAGVSLRLNVPGQTAITASVFSPDASGDCGLLSVNDGSIELPPIRCYSVAVIRIP